MNHLKSFETNKSLIKKFGENNAHIIWVLSLYLDFPDRFQLGTESLTDGTGDKKIDFIRLDVDSKKIVFAQGYYSSKKVDSAPANKASDLNTAVAWLLSGNIEDIPSPLSNIIKACREAIDERTIEQIDLLYVHNLSESIAVSKELNTVADQLKLSLPDDGAINVIYKELGIQHTEELFTAHESAILIKDRLVCPAEIKFEEKGPMWSAYILSLPGNWLREQFSKYGDNLFSANYRGFLGISKRKKINIGIKNTAEKQPDNFWVFNNGITILTTKLERSKGKNYFNGLSIINGAQTTGAIGSLTTTKSNLSNVKVLTRVIECSDARTIEEIIKYNNTQNKITTWDKFSNSPEQKRINEEFLKYGHNYSLKRGFSSTSPIGIEVVTQALIALEGYYKEANGGKNGIFENDKMYRVAFENKKARHILFAYIITRAIDERRGEFRTKEASNTLIAIEKRQLNLLRNLRFKYFFISIIGETLNIILGKQVNINQIGFTPEYSKSENKTLNDLIAEIMPLVNFLLTLTVSSITKDFSEYYREPDVFKDITNKVSAILYATLSATTNTDIDKLKKILSE